MQNFPPILGIYRPVLIILKDTFLTDFLKVLPKFSNSENPLNWLCVNTMPLQHLLTLENATEGQQQINSVYVRTRWRHSPSLLRHQLLSISDWSFSYVYLFQCIFRSVLS